jgi:hypothetical protein
VSRDESFPVNDDERCTLKRYDDFRAAAEYVAAAIASVPTVESVALFGSVALSPRIESGRRKRGPIHEPKDVDLAVWLDGDTDLDSLRKQSAQALNRLWHERQMGVALHQVDIFLLDVTGKYPGRLCHFNQCPKHKPQCQLTVVASCRFCSSMTVSSPTALSRCTPRRIQILYDRGQLEKGAVLDKIPL